ncbi:hypothetical protein [Capillimicrobium parvum]|uniref:Uncharacterized protein n=1 Tax=Capillimicrobium parvum TaxID=2884022 RepID=A0A9E6Y0Q0_9ACTN|nr:hypothetical protein [Capillimicrobium parvum]UGS38042.1 hypothetical protein DSM104329_04464 [Capillimicrobium parvum]
MTWDDLPNGGARARAERARDHDAGESYYWAPGHDLDAVTDTEYLEITRAEEYDAPTEHCARGIGG